MLDMIADILSHWKGLLVALIVGAVLTTLDDEKEYSYREKYVQDSVYMQLDPLNIVQTELVYKIQADDESLAQNLGNVYENMINSVVKKAGI